MIEMKIPVQKFDAKGFVADILRFLKEEGIGGETPETVVAEVMEDGSTPYWGDIIPNRDILHELLEEGKPLFFTFSNTNWEIPLIVPMGKAFSWMKKMKRMKKMKKNPSFILVRQKL